MPPAKIRRKIGRETDLSRLYLASPELLAAHFGLGFEENGISEIGIPDATRGR